MFDAIPQQYHFVIGLGGLVFLMLFVASAAQKYQAYQYQKELALKRMLRAVLDLENYLGQIDGAGLPKTLLVMLHKEILARYLTIRHIYKKMENIDQMISEAQNRLQLAESGAESRRIKPKDRQILNLYVAGISGLINFLQSHAHVAGMNQVQRNKYQAELSNLRAEIYSDYNLAEARAMAEQGMWSDAGKYVRDVMSFIHGHGPATDRTSKLYHQANRVYQQVIAKQVPGSEVSPDTAGNAEAMASQTPIA